MKYIKLLLNKYRRKFATNKYNYTIYLITWDLRHKLNNNNFSVSK